MPDVVVVGAGVSGLCCARELHAAGLDVLVLERGDRARRPRAHRRGRRLPARPRLPGAAHGVSGGATDARLRAPPPARLRERGARAHGRPVRAPRRPVPAPVPGAREPARRTRQRAGQAARRTPAAAPLRRVHQRDPHGAAGHDGRGAGARGVLARPGRGVLPPLPGRHLPRPLARDLEPPLRLRLQDVLGGRGGAAGRRHGGHPAPAGGEPPGGGRPLRRDRGVRRPRRGRPGRRRAHRRRPRWWSPPTDRRRRGSPASSRRRALAA